MTAFDMPSALAGFPARGRWLIDHYMVDLSLTENQAAGLPGNFGFESRGLIVLQETAPIAGRGGRGWPMWTADRRMAFEAWAKKAQSDPDGDKTIYDYTLVELRGSYRHTVEALLKTTTVAEAVWSVGQTYERPFGTTPSHLPGYEGRLTYARRALAGPRVSPASDARPTPPAPDIASLWLAVSAATRALQTALAAAGYDPGPIDGIDGDKTKAAVLAWRRAQ